MVVCGVLLTGCGDKPADSTSSTSAAPTQNQEAGEIQEAVSKAASAAVEEVKKQSATAVAEAQQQARAAYDDLSRKLVESTKGQTDKLLQDVGADLEKRTKQLSESLKENQTLTQQLQGAVQALLGGQDTEAVSEMGELAGAKLTPDQTTLAKDAYNAMAAFVTQRNFSTLEGMDSDVARLVNSVWKGNYSEALPPLQKIYGQATLTPAQKELLSTTFDQYAPTGWKDAASSLQKGVDALKKFGN
ncbi:MAG TPA: hypothetical protein DCY13_09425 [Verrucomicrobiales bacterium]|nr:hypothetical protein [Verrucomicrobiales bacterium]